MGISAIGFGFDRRHRAHGESACGFAATVAALEARGFGTEVVDDLDAARKAVLARIPYDSSVATNSSVTVEETGVAVAMDDGGPADSAAR